ncbi:helix-turn-helix domain-containing protein [Acinetobacter colistiniresistens]|uniref:helix-turn-helix domain-containing protein n=1 Tax=Acinetobacter colistiniresistens TaxID=280145 RepID=UPI0012508831|nr:helix-turn-helix domain-containing protein [Acinetobacter colistiniresistens]
MTEVAVIDAGIQRCVHDKENPFLMLSVGVTRDTRLSVEDLGFLAILLDHPNNFKFNVPYLVKRCRLSKEKTRKLLNKLIDLGYVMANQIRNHGKFLGMIYRVFEKPLMLVKAAAGEQKQLPVKTVSAVDEKSVHGESENGKIDTNKYDEEVSKKQKENTNVCISSKEIKILKVSVEDEDLKNALIIRNCKPITDQQILDAYVAEFNKNADQYSQLSEIQRKANLAIFIKRCIENHKQNTAKAKAAEKKSPTPTTGVKTIKQAFFFAKQLSASHAFSSRYSNQGESAIEFEVRIRQNLLNEKYFTDYKPFLLEMGLISSE